MPLLVVCAADRGVLVPLEDLEDSRLLLALGFLLFELDQMLLGVGRTRIGHPEWMPMQAPV
jgi:hypothetical protein